MCGYCDVATARRLHERMNAADANAFNVKVNFVTLHSNRTKYSSAQTHIILCTVRKTMVGNREWSNDELRIPGNIECVACVSCGETWRSEQEQNTPNRFSFRKIKANIAADGKKVWIDGFDLSTFFISVFSTTFSRKTMNFNSVVFVLYKKRN